jgi:preprotein translocase subunit SecE
VDVEVLKEIDMPKDELTWLNIACALTGLIFYYLFTQTFQLVGLETGWNERYEWFSLAGKLVSGVLALGVVYMLRFNPERKEYYMAAIAELKKVVWPSKDDTRKMTIVVVLVVGFFSIVLSLFDWIWAAALKQLIS